MLNVFLFLSVFLSECNLLFGSEAFTDQKEGPWVNIFVHGTVGSNFSFMNLRSIKKDKLDNTLFKGLCAKTRGSSYLYYNQLMNGFGMHQVFLKDIGGPVVTSKNILQVFDEISKEVFQVDNNDLYFLYGWTGLLSLKERVNDAGLLYKDILALKEDLSLSGINNPRIRIFGFSHGGNVALSLAGVYYELFSTDNSSDEFYSNFKPNDFIKKMFEINENIKDIPRNKIFIDELVMIGTPIQKETSLFMASELFGKVFSFYSTGDKVQTMDFLSTGGKSNRVLNTIDFSEDKRKIFKNCFEIQVTIINDNNILINPTHKELWFVFREKFNRPNFISPIPILCFFPIFYKLVAQMSNGLKSPHHYQFEILNVGLNYNFVLKDKKRAKNQLSLSINRDVFNNLKNKLFVLLNEQEIYPVKGFAEKMIKLVGKVNA